MIMGMGKIKSINMIFIYGIHRFKSFYPSYSLITPDLLSRHLTELLRSNNNRSQVTHSNSAGVHLADSVCTRPSNIILTKLNKVCVLVPLLR